MVSGLINMTFQVGSAVGLAVMVALASQAGDMATPLDGFHAAFFGAATVAGTRALVALALLRSAPVAREVPVG